MVCLELCMPFATGFIPSKLLVHVLLVSTQQHCAYGVWMGSSAVGVFSCTADCYQLLG